MYQQCGNNEEQVDLKSLRQQRIKAISKQKPYSNYIIYALIAVIFGVSMFYTYSKTSELNQKIWDLTLKAGVSSTDNSISSTINNKISTLEMQIKNLRQNYVQTKNTIQNIQETLKNRNNGNNKNSGNIGINVNSIRDISEKLEKLTLHVKKMQISDVKAMTMTQIYLEDQLRKLHPQYRKQQFAQGGPQAQLDMTTDYYEEFDGDQHRYHPDFSKILQDYYASVGAKTILDLGCGKCDYIKDLKKKGFEVLGYDGNSNTTVWSDGLAIQKDLSKRFIINKTFDYVQSVEVGEHITYKNQFNFIWNLCKHAKKGIVITWAQMTGLGKRHVNEQSLEHVIGRIEAFGFKLNTHQREKYKTRSYRRNILIFDRIATRVTVRYSQQGDKKWDK